MRNMKISFHIDRWERQTNKHQLGHRRWVPQVPKLDKCPFRIPNQTVCEWAEQKNKKKKIKKKLKWKLNFSLSDQIFIFSFFLAVLQRGKMCFLEWKTNFQFAIFFFFLSIFSSLTSITIEDCTSVLLYSQPLSQCCKGHDSFGSSESMEVFWRIIFQSTAYLRHLSYTCSPFLCKVKKKKIKRKRFDFNLVHFIFLLFRRGRLGENWQGLARLQGAKLKFWSNSWYV